MNGVKRVFIVPKWGGNPYSDWYQWLSSELVKKNIVVHALSMPNTEDPDMDEWIGSLKSQVDKPDTNTYLVGHSMGAQAILRYLEGLKGQEKIGGAVFVAGFITIKNEAMVGDAKRVLTPWVEKKIDLQKARSHCEKCVSMFSGNDPYIPVSDSKIFEKELGSKVIVIPNAGHFTQANGGYNELHVCLNELLKIIK